jgi:hypothetical protein
MTLSKQSDMTAMVLGLAFGAAAIVPAFAAGGGGGTPPSPDLCQGAGLQRKEE